ncbi:MAG: TetR/AcrR family transcriptional regulator [Thermoleophilia bacterium]
MSAPGAPRPLRQDAQRTVARVVEVATRVLADDPHATVQEIADTAGIGRATVYRHFPSREALLSAITTAAFREIRETLDGLALDRAEPVEGLRVALDAFFEVGDRYRFLAVDRSPHEHHPDKQAAMLDVFAPLAALLDRAQASGVVRRDLPPEWVRSALGALMRTAFELTDSGELAREEAPEIVLRTFLEGVSAGTGGPT